MIRKKSEPLIDQNNHDIEAKEVKELLKKDSDGYYSLDYLRIAAGELDTIDAYYESLARVCNYIKTALDANRNDEHILEKYNWLADYYNTVVAELEASNGTTGLDIIEVRAWSNQ